MKRRGLSRALRLGVATVLVTIGSGLVVPGTASGQAATTVPVMYVGADADVSTPQGRCVLDLGTPFAQVDDGSFFAGPARNSPDCHGFRLILLLTYRDADPAAGTPTRVDVTAMTLLVRNSDNGLCGHDTTTTALTNFRWDPDPWNDGVFLPQRTSEPAFTIRGCGVSAEMNHAYWHP